MSGAQDSLLYSRLETILASEIDDGDLRVGEQLPTEDRYCLYRPQLDYERLQHRGDLVQFMTHLVRKTSG